MAEQYLDSFVQRGPTHNISKMLVPLLFFQIWSKYFCKKVPTQKDTHKAIFVNWEYLTLPFVCSLNCNWYFPNSLLLWLGSILQKAAHLWYGTSISNCPYQNSKPKTSNSNQTKRVEDVNVSGWVNLTLGLQLSHLRQFFWLGCYGWRFNAKWNRPGTPWHRNNFNRLDRCNWCRLWTF